jgi:Zn-dependent M28 family amino/carboxypeptidase
MTARYVAREFEAFGLEPAFESGYIQTYSTGAAAAAPNVAAVLRGSDPTLRDTYVVFSAHMDHVGTGPADATGDTIYNGADDDASGTAAVIEIAEAFSRLDPAPARSVIFLTVSGEEGGLWGSQAFVEDGGIPARSMAANVNIDMIGRNASDSVVAIGLRYSDMGERIRGLAVAHPDLGLTVVDDLWPDERFFFRSDHYNFASAGVPAIFLFAGTHEDYHMPSDEVDLIDADKIARIARLAFRLGLDIASDPVEPQWTREGLLEVRPPNRN